MSDDAATRCRSRTSEQPWADSELSLGERSLMVRTIDGSRPVEWLPYGDVVSVTEVGDGDDSHIEITLRDHRQVSLQLDRATLDTLLAALATSTATPEQRAPAPAEFGHLGPGTGETSPTATAPRRRALLLALAGVAVLAALVVLAVALLGGGDDVPATTSTAPATTAPAPVPETTSTTEPSEREGPEAVLAVQVTDVVVTGPSDAAAIYLALSTRSLTDATVDTFDAVFDVRSATATWSGELRCAASIEGGSARSGQLETGQPVDPTALADCRVAGWPIEVDDPEQVALAEAVRSAQPWQATTSLRRVALADGTIIEATG